MPCGVGPEKAGVTHKPEMAAATGEPLEEQGNGEKSGVPYY